MTKKLTLREVLMTVLSALVLVAFLLGLVYLLVRSEDWTKPTEVKATPQSTKLTPDQNKALYQRLDRIAEALECLCYTSEQICSPEEGGSK